MKRISLVLVALSIAGLAQAQAPSQPPARAAAAPATGPAPTGLIVGSGNFFSPIVADLDKALVFYRDGLGFETMGAPGEASGDAPLLKMFGLPDAKLRYQIARPPASRTGVEIVEVSGAGGKPLDRALQDPGAFMLIVLVRDIDAALVKVKAVGAPVLTRGGMAMTVPGGAHPARMAVVKDPDGHFVELAQLDPLPETQAPASANVIGVRVRLIVDDVDKAMRLYHDALGMSVMLAPSFHDDSGVLAGFGLRGGQYRAAMLHVPTSGLVFELMDFKDLDRKTVHGRIQDPGSTRIQLQVRDVDAAIAALKQAGGTVQTTGGKSMDLPAGPNTIKVAVVRDPNDLNVVLIQAAAPAAAPK
jgi:catechol 2,3-dioxygenase-like lactoylglutathione lyase family enzyme